MAIIDLKKKYNEQVVNKLHEKYQYKNKLAVPAIEKIVINRGFGEINTNAKAKDISVDVMMAITGQKPILTKSKKSISNFKLREGQTIGAKVTMRSTYMWDFMTKFIHVCLPKIRDFRGISPHAFDGRGNYTLGVKEEIIFPEVEPDKIDRSRGFDITFVTTAKTDQEAYDLFDLLGFPFRK